MNITYKEAVEGYKHYFNHKEIEKDLSISISGDIKAPSALSSIQMMENMDNLVQKLNFVHSMLLGNGVSIHCKDKVLVSFQVTEGMILTDIEYFRQYPGVLRFLVDSVFGIFLKNLYPLSSESQEA